MEDHFIIKNGEVFFKVGIKEGQIIQDLQQNLDRDSILLKHQLTNDDFETFINELKKIEIIGEAKKEPFNILFIKVPLFNPTSFLE
ncbi:TPA: peptidase M50, partial [Bacillus toyonensis]|nr:peptidase M50 [Bacillus toyonensis]